MILVWTIFAASDAIPQVIPNNLGYAPRWVKSFESTKADAQLPNMPSKVISFDTTEGTFMNVDVSPDGGELIFDLLGDIYVLPVDGGQAVPLTTGRAWDQAPRYSPDGTFVYFVSDRIGSNSIWQLTLSDGGLKQIVTPEFTVWGTPNWSQDGSHLLAGLRVADGRGPDVVPHTIDPNNGYTRPIDPPSEPAIDYFTFEFVRPSVKIFSAVQTTNDQVYFSQSTIGSNSDRFVVRLYTLDRNTQMRVQMTPSDVSYNEYKPVLSHDGNLLAYFRQYADRRTEIRILNRTTGQDAKLAGYCDADDAAYSVFQASRPNYAFTPDDQQLVFSHGGKIQRVNLADGSSKIIPFRANVEREVWVRAKPTAQKIEDVGEATVVRWPSVSSDGKTVVFTAIGYVWAKDVQTGETRRLTGSTDFEYMPTLSPDGQSVAYVSFAQVEDGYSPGRLMVVDIYSGTTREILAASGESYLFPNWSDDGRKIAVVQEKGDAGTVKAMFGWTSAARGEFHEVAPAPASEMWLSRNVYSRFVGFDKSGQSLLFSFPTSRTETVLAAADLESNVQRTLAFGSSDVGGISPAPNLRNIVLTRRDGTVYLVPFNSRAEAVKVSTMAPEARRVSNDDGYYVTWNGSDQFTYGFGNNVYRYGLDRKVPDVLNVTVRYEKRSASQPIVFEGARLITMSNDSGSGSVIEAGTVVVDGQRISAIGSIGDVPIPTNALVIDLMGKTIMPGFLDTHYHRIGGSGGAIGLSSLKMPNPAFGDRSAIRYGVTTAWEPGGVADDGVPATADLQSAGRILGPRWSHSAMGSVGDPREFLTNYADAVAAVDRRHALGADVLKEYNTPTRQQRQWLSAAALEKGLGIISHLESFDGMMTRIVDGYTGGDHPHIPMPFFKDVYELLKQTGYIWTPNIVISTGSVGSNKDSKSYYWQEVLEKRPEELKKQGSMTSPVEVDRVENTQLSVPYHINRIRRVAEQAAAAAQSGAHIGVSAHGMPGSRLHEEMWYLWKGGMPIEAVLRAATIGNAEKLGLQEEIGSLEPGKIADLLVLDDNPLEDIINTLSIKYTIQRGIIYDSATAKRTDISRMQE